MQTFYASDFGVQDGKDVSRQLDELFHTIRQTAGEKTLVFTRGTYYISRENRNPIHTHITNTAGKREYRAPNEPAVHRFALHLDGIDDLTIEGGGAQFIMRGPMTNLAVTHCRNLMIRGLTLDTADPNLHRLDVVEAGRFHVTFRAHDRDILEKSGRFYNWVGEGYRLSTRKGAETSWWNASIRPGNERLIYRSDHPLAGAFSMKKVGPALYRCRYMIPKNYEPGQRFYVFDTTRYEVGIFADGCENLCLEEISQHFNYSLAFVAQDCRDITLRSLRFQPRPGSGLEVTSLADFIQICMCSGQVTVEDCVFSGACDDCLNVHGIHFSADRKKDGRILAKFRHPQTWGFNPLHAGDHLRFIDPQSMLPLGENRIHTSRLADPYTIELTLEDPSAVPDGNFVIEDADRCPELIFRRNEVDRIITRGLLLTTSGKTVIENNHFTATGMSGILISDDARNWYESGFVRDVTIRGNTFDFCRETPVRILPENRIHRGAVHRGIRILNNRFRSYHGTCITAKSTDDLEIRGNDFACGDPLKTENCGNVRTDF